MENGKIKFKSIREILDKYTSDCNECPYYNVEVELEDEDSIPPYDSCNLDCFVYYAKQIKKEILRLIDEVEIEK